MTVTVMLKGENPASLNMREGQRILHAALAEGLQLPYECGTGTCGQCRAVLESGTIEDLWPDAPGNQYIRRIRNEILMCQSAPSTDCALRVSKPAISTSTDPICPSYFDAHVNAIDEIAPSVVRLSVETERVFEALPGQFVLLETPGIQGPRAYSVTDTGLTTHLEFLVKRKPDGLFTPWLFSPDCKGKPVKLFGPLGRATFRKDVDRNLLLAAGGTGVASTISILLAAKKSNHFEKNRVRIYFGVRTPEDMFCLDDLKYYSDKFPSAVTVNVCYSDSTRDFESHNVRERSGFIHEIVDHDLVSINSDETTALMAGPPPMIEAMLKVLVKGKFSPRQIRYDKFS